MAKKAFVLNNTPTEIKHGLFFFSFFEFSQIFLLCTKLTTITELLLYSALVRRSHLNNFGELVFWKQSLKITEVSQRNGMKHPSRYSSLLPHSATPALTKHRKHIEDRTTSQTATSVLRAIFHSTDSPRGDLNIFEELLAAWNLNYRQRLNVFPMSSTFAR